ncbi:MAG: hypothetical protein PVJ38_05670 [Candidatus Bathyarchaeota archaeon]
MTKKNYVAIIVAPIVILVAVVSALNMGLLDKNTEIENLRVEVSYSGSWEGVIYSNEEAQQVSGFTKKTIIVFRPPGDTWKLSFTAEKKDDSTNQLKVKIKTIDGAVLGEAKTVEPYGKISLSIEIS